MSESEAAESPDLELESAPAPAPAPSPPQQSDVTSPEPATATDVTAIIEDSLAFDLVDDDDNMDSGIGAEKSESGSSDIPMPSAEEAKNEDRPGASTSADLPTEENLRSACRFTNLRFISGTRSRNYRFRGRVGPNVDSDSDDDTRMDSDDNSREEQPERNNSSDDSDVEIGEENDSDSTIIIERDWTDTSFRNDDSNDYETPHVLLKRKPKHEWSVIKELMNRELGNSIRPGKCGKSDVIFEQRFYGSLHAVERLELMYKLNKHKGCVNSINFHPEGNLLASGSDDLNIIIWDWATNTVRRIVKTDHKSNIFQSRFLYLNSTSQIDIVSCARDGQVLLTQVLTGGGTPIRRHLAQHSRSAHKLYTNAAEPHIVVSVGEDAHVNLSDVRQETPNRILTVRDNDVKVPLYSVVCHPLVTHEMCVAGQGRKVMVFDRRKGGANAEPIKSFCPDFFRISDNNPVKKKPLNVLAYVTCAVYNHNGSEILASYNDDDIYLFDTTTDCETNGTGHGFSYFYCGHRNSATFKGVSFFGPHSEFIVSGSDCGNIYIWDKKTEAIVQWMMGDEGGVVNCVECHPRFPVLATSGLDKDVKIWVPSNETDPKLDGLRETVIRNARDRSGRPFFHFLPTVFGIIRRHGDGHRTEESDSFSDESDSTHDDDRNDEATC
ncbi:DDB1- and CUL4-associated factor 8 [Arctopsyche grandis]|uniref:DDB1- and CUL4-associated factor 8 n=1 Tax=Arctopsyche grandis TaxID=121162 RepID=UPI00406DA064